MKRVLLSITVALACAAALSAQGLTILHTNDTHSHIDPVRGGAKDGLGGVIERSVYIDSVRNAVGRKNLLLLDAGDFSQGTSYFPILQGNLEVELMNAMKYDVSTLGNHEFDNGLEELERRLKMAKFKVVCANYDFSGCGVGRYVKPYTIVRRGGMKIGIIGLLTDVMSVVDREIAQKMNYIEPVAVTNRYAEYLKDEKECDIVICLTHIGYECDVELASRIRNVDIIVGGHSHTELTAPQRVKDLDGKEVVIVTDGCWGIHVGNLTLD